MATSRGLQIFAVQAVLFAITIGMLMQESTKLVLYSASAYVRDCTNVRRASACVLYIGGVLFALYRETGVVRAVASENPIPMLVSISDSRISGIYAEVLCWQFAIFRFVAPLIIFCPFRQCPRCSCGLKYVPPHWQLSLCPCLKISSVNNTSQWPFLP
jgi:hypothetical protein